LRGFGADVAAEAAPTSDEAIAKHAGGALAPISRLKPLPHKVKLFPQKMEALPQKMEPPPPRVWNLDEACRRGFSPDIAAEAAPT